MSLGHPLLPFKAAKPPENTLRPPINNPAIVDSYIAQNEAFDLQQLDGRGGRPTTEKKSTRPRM